MSEEKINQNETLETKEEVKYSLLNNPQTGMMNIIDQIQSSIVSNLA